MHTVRQSVATNDKKKEYATHTEYSFSFLIFPKEIWNKNSIWCNSVILFLLHNTIAFAWCIGPLRYRFRNGKNYWVNNDKFFIRYGRSVIILIGILIVCARVNKCKMIRHCVYPWTNWEIRFFISIYSKMFACRLASWMERWSLLKTNISLITFYSDDITIRLLYK